MLYRLWTGFVDLVTPETMVYTSQLLSTLDVQYWRYNPVIISIVFDDSPIDKSECWRCIDHTCVDAVTLHNTDVLLVLRTLVNKCHGNRLNGNKGVWNTGCCYEFDFVFRQLVLFLCALNRSAAEFG